MNNKQIKTTQAPSEDAVVEASVDEGAAQVAAQTISGDAAEQTSADEALTQTPAGEAGVAIIGYGTAGVNALIALRTAGYKGTIRVFSETGILPYSPILTSYYAGGEKSYEECFPWSAEELNSLAPEVLSNSPVVELDPEAHIIRTADGAFEYTKCIITSGATPQCWGFPDVEGYRPLVLRTMDDALRLKATLENSACRRILISGASMVALKTLEACLEHDLKTTLVGMNPHVLDFNALPEAAIRFEKGLEAKGVRLLLGQTISAVKVLGSEAGERALKTNESKAGDSTNMAEDNPKSTSSSPGRQLEVTFSSGEVGVFDEIAVAHGVKGNLDFVAKGSLQTEQALIVDDYMRTSNPDVYAAGDVAQATELITGEKRIVGVWKNAAVQGACAGRTIAAELAGGEIPEEARYKGSIPTNTIAVKGTLFISAGTMEITANRRTEVDESSEKMTVVKVYEKNADGASQLVGFNLVCDEDEAGSKAYDIGAMLTLRIENGLD